MPPSALLQKWQTNDLFEAIQIGGLDPREFELKNNAAEAQVNHKWSRSFFTIGGDARLYRGRCIVGDGIDWPYEHGWQALMTRFSRWVRDVKNDLDTPDLWAELRREADLLRGAPTEAGDNTPFTRRNKKR